MKKILFLKKDENGFYWIHDNNAGILDKDIGPLGPYNSRSEAKEDADGLTDTILSNPDIWPLDSLVPKKRKAEITDTTPAIKEEGDRDS